MENIGRYLLDFLKYTAGVSSGVIEWVYPLTAVFAIWLFAYLCTAAFRFIVMPAVQKVTEKTKAQWDDYLFNRKVMKAFRRMIPPVIWYAALPVVMSGWPTLLVLLMKVCNIYLVVAALLFVSAFLRSLYEYPKGTASCATAR